MTLVDLLAVLVHDLLMAIQRMATATLERTERAFERRFAAVNVDVLSQVRFALEFGVAELTVERTLVAVSVLLVVLNAGWRGRFEWTELTLVDVRFKMRLGVLS